MRRFLPILLVFCMHVCCFRAAAAEGVLAWPVACVPGQSCLETRNDGIGYPDIGNSSPAVQCRAPAYKGHTGTDIYVVSVESDIAVLAAADGQVMWVNDGLFDRCPVPGEPDCRPQITPLCSASAGSWGPEMTLSCTDNACNCLWGFNAGNYVLIRHDGIPGLAFTLYAHLQKGSIRVSRGEQVSQGEQIGRVGSSGNAARPHLHFGVWRSVVGGIELADPWGSGCGSGQKQTLWNADPPFLSYLPSAARHSGLPAETPPTERDRHPQQLRPDPGR